MCCDPKVGDGRVPGARDCAERRQEEVVDGAEEDVREGNGGYDEDNVVRKPRDGEGDCRSHCVETIQGSADMRRSD